MTSRIRTSAGTGLAALALTAAGVAVAPSAHAAKSDCPREYVCVWNNTSYSGKPTWKSKGNLANLKSSGGLSIFNNGVRYPGADHIWWKVTWSNGQTASGCLHYPPDSGNSITVSGSVTLNHAKWGGEC
ncbi:peptidase inhibitor family I36 protein [Streptomyces sp. HNM0663]|uniref:Peptidase inhibitor family I36 protein n=1 Tax=Streptomyces chengmaiensis TaxID=3040919 RepID=A0ABT6HV16_9ACTN|nr:peptidase inhibitor family I36 protein [Streptomyces chengmaiensis]MDH2392546.1 peptidase inhibitor family I36 protein [Streptomyces chengmaiensis]